MDEDTVDEASNVPYRRSRLNAFRARLPVRPEIHQKFSPEDLEQLRALGYVDVPQPDAGAPSPDPPDG